jgi:hypothetical protein
MTQLRVANQEEWNRRDLAKYKDELAEKTKLMDNMIAKDLHQRDLDRLMTQSRTALV